MFIIIKFFWRRCVNFAQKVQVVGLFCLTGFAVLHVSCLVGVSGEFSVWRFFPSMFLTLTLPPVVLSQ